MKFKQAFCLSILFSFISTFSLPNFAWASDDCELYATAPYEYFRAHRSANELVQNRANTLKSEEVAIAMERQFLNDLTNAASNSLRKQAEDIGRAYSNALKQQAEQVWKLVLGIQRWTESSEAEPLVYTDNTGLLRIKTSRLLELVNRSSQISQLQHLKDLPPEVVESLDIYADPSVAEHIKPVLQQKTKKGANISELPPAEVQAAVINQRVQEIVKQIITDINARIAQARTQINAQTTRADLINFCNEAQCSDQLQVLADTLAKELPLGFLTWKQPKQTTKLEQQTNKLVQFDLNQSLNAANSVDGNIRMEASGGSNVDSTFIPEISTVLLTPKGNKMFPKTQEPTFVLHHGYGTNESVAMGFGQTFAPLGKFGNVLAYDLPNAGLGLPIEGVDLAVHTAYLNHVGRWIADQAERAEVESPLIFVGRSAGSTLGQIKDLYDYYIYDPYTIKVLTAFSNPQTINAQVDLLIEQGRLGIVSDLDHNVLEHTRKLWTRYGHLINETPHHKRLDHSLRQIFTINILSESDEDGGRSVVQDHLDFFAQLPYAATYIIRDPLKDTPFVSESDPLYPKRYPFLESRHHVLPMRKNVSHAQANELFPGLPMELWPKAENQFLEAVALTYAFMDYLISLEPLVAAATNRTEEPLQDTFIGMLSKIHTMRIHRKSLAVESYLDWYLAKIKIDRGEVEASNPETFFSNQEEIRVLVAQGKEVPEQLLSGLNPAEYQKLDLVNRIGRIQQFLNALSLQTSSRLQKDFNLP